MSRSYRKTPYHGLAGTSAGSMKWYRRAWNSKERRRWKNAIASGDYENAEWILPWNEWDSPRDGIAYDQEWFETYKGRIK